MAAYSTDDSETASQYEDAIKECDRELATASRRIEGYALAAENARRDVQRHVQEEFHALAAAQASGARDATDDLQGALDRVRDALATWEHHKQVAEALVRDAGRHDQVPSLPPKLGEELRQLLRPIGIDGVTVPVPNVDPTAVSEAPVRGKSHVS